MIGRGMDDGLIVEDTGSSAERRRLLQEIILDIITGSRIFL